MHSGGHAGLSLTILSFLMITFDWVNDKAIIICMLIVALSSLPDIDLRLCFVEHRGPTHTLFFGIISGIVFAILFDYAGWDWQIGFISAFGAITLHILGDIFTYQELKPFWPFSGYRIALRLCRSESRVVNKGLSSLGGVAFFVVLLKYAGLF